MVRRVSVVPWDKNWEQMFLDELAQLKKILSGLSQEIHHFGSTSVKGMAAKPIVDIMVVVADANAVEEAASRLSESSYIDMGNICSGWRFVIKGNEEERTCHIHIFKHGDRKILDHLLVRDFLRSNERIAGAYSQLKLDLAKSFPNDIDSYIAGKSSFMADLEDKARGWAGICG